MARARVPPAVLFLLLLLVVAHVGTMGTAAGDQVVPARTCESQSRTFKGLCFSDTNCRNVCRGEGFEDGHCRGFRQRCFCLKPC